MLCLIVLTSYNEQRGRRMIVLLPLGLYWECDGVNYQVKEA